MKVLTLFATLLVASAHAQEQTADSTTKYKPNVIGIHIGSHHFQNNNEWNDVNGGIYLRWSNNLQLGTLRNSESKQSIYLAKMWEHNLSERFSLNATLGLITGYKSNPVMPLGTAGFAIKLTNSWYISTSFLPKVTPKGSAALHVTIEHRQ